MYSSLNKTKVFGGRFSSSAHKREKCEKQIESFSVPCLDALDVCKELLELNVSLIVVAFFFFFRKKKYFIVFVSGESLVWYGKEAHLEEKRNI